MARPVLVSRHSYTSQDTEIPTIDCSTRHAYFGFKHLKSGWIYGFEYKSRVRTKAVR